jgi:plasmid stability protein
LRDEVYAWLPRKREEREYVNAFVDAAVRGELERLARQNDRSVSAEIRRALTLYLEGETRQTPEEAAARGNASSAARRSSGAESREDRPDDDYVGTIGPAQPCVRRRVASREE